MGVNLKTKDMSLFRHIQSHFDYPKRKKRSEESDSNQATRKWELTYISHVF